MSMNIPVLKDAVARWQAYEDRGISPKCGGGVGLNGNACALGDIAANIGLTDWEGVSEAIGLDVIYTKPDRVSPNYFNKENKISGTNDFRNSLFGRAECISDLIYGLNDFYKEWPITEVQRLIEWEEASINFDITNYVVSKETALV